MFEIKFKEIETVKKIVSLAPIILFIWVIYQFTLLLRIGELWIFSWGQVINDTLKIIIPIFLGQIIYFCSAKIWTTLREDSRIWGILSMILLWSGIMIPISIWIWILWVTVFNWNVEYMRNSTIFIFWNYTIWYLVGYYDKTKKHIITILFGGIILLSSCIYIWTQEFNNLFLQHCEQEKCEWKKVLYANDKYIITEDGIKYGNNNERIFK